MTIIIDMAININDNSCQIIIGGDLNVDFSRDRLHTAMLEYYNTGVTNLNNKFIL